MACRIAGLNVLAAATFLVALLGWVLALLAIYRRTGRSRWPPLCKPMQFFGKPTLGSTLSVLGATNAAIKPRMASLASLTWKYRQARHSHSTGKVSSTGFLSTDVIVAIQV